MFPDSPTATKVLFPKVTSSRFFEVGEVALSQDEPLSVDFIMVPLSPTPTKVLFAEMTPQRLVAVGEVTLSQDEPLSVDLTISLNPAPYPPTAINTPEPEEEELSDDDEVELSVVVEVLSEVVVSSSEVVVEDELSVDADEPPSSLPQEIMVRLKRSTNKMCKILLIFSLH